MTRQEQEIAIFTEALSLPPEARAALLLDRCQGDAALLRRLQSLLQRHDQSGDFLETPATRLGTNAGPTVGEKPGDRIGHYKLLQQIGEGGCGVVFLAEQEEPVRRKVALKIVKPGMDTRSVIARFEAERQVLALMDHPNIAKVFDAGATESGRPYFVMELVRGVRILEYCDQSALTTAERLGLFVQVCRAMQHAHQKGIIHRDIKPSNILVSKTLEGTPLPVIIDFGIAKATTNQRLTDKTLFTAFEMLIGTPAYMSPEQAELTGVDVDTRTDIYSLGVLLYEMLTGSTPFDSRALMKAGLDEIRRIIREKEPARPSTRLSTMTAADLGAAAERRRAAAPALIRLVRGDLDWIVMKALEKDRTRRYETANGLARDVERFLANEPIAARPPSFLYKLRKMFLRNKLLCSGLAAVLALLLGGLLAVSASWNAERKARKSAQIEEARNRQITSFLKSMLAGVGPSVARGRDTVMLREILDHTADQIGTDLGAHPLVEAEIRSLIGNLYLDIGNYDRAEKMQAAAAALYRRAAGDKSAETASALSALGNALWKERKLNEAEAAHQEALAIRKALYGSEHRDVAASLNNLGAVYRRQHRLPEAEAITRESLAIREKLCGKESLEAADSLRNLSIILGDEGNRAEAEATGRQMLEIRRRLLGPDDPQVASALADVAWAAGFNGKLDEAEGFERQAFEIQRNILGDQHPDVAKSLFSLGERMRQRGKLTEAEGVLSAAISIQKKLLPEDHPAILDSIRNLGWTLEQEGKWPEAELMHREALAGWRRQAPADSAQVIGEIESVARALASQKRFAEAEQMLNEALQPALRQNSSSAGLLLLRVDLLGRAGRWREAADDAELVVKYQPDKDEAWQILGALYLRLNERQRFERLCPLVLDAFGQTASEYTADKAAKLCLLAPSKTVDVQRCARLAEMAVKQGEHDSGALPFFRVGLALADYRRGRYEAALAAGELVLQSGRVYAEAQACAVIAMCHQKLGHPDEARSFLARGEALAPAALPARDATDPGKAWLAWLFARISLDEAAVTLNAEKP